MNYSKNQDQAFENVPGIVLMTGGFLRRHEAQEIMLPKLGVSKKPLATVTLGNWLKAYLFTRLDIDHATYNGPDGTTVLFDGYLSDVNGTNVGHGFWNKPAQTIAALYRKHGKNFLHALRGSYTCLIVNERLREAFLFCDRCGSRPLFYKQEDIGSLFVAPEVSIIISASSTVPKLNKGAVGEFLISGYYHSNHTLFENVFKLPQAGQFFFKKGEAKIGRYWRIKFNETMETISEDILIDEYDALLRQATRRLLRVVEKPFLFLSGGIDSRLVLGYLMSEGSGDIPLVSFGVPGEGDDAQVAQDLANTLGMPLQEFPIQMSDFLDSAEDAVLRSDCQAEVIDAPSTMHIWDKLKEQYRTFFNGDECFGWRPAKTIDSALNSNLLFRMSQAPRLMDWLDPCEGKTIEKAINETLSSLVRDVEESDPQNIKDKQYYEERVGNYINTFTANRLRIFEQARPLLDEDVIEFIKTLPIRMRWDKLFLRKVLGRKHPALIGISFAKKDSLPKAVTFAKAFKENERLTKYIREELTKRLDPRLSALLNGPKFNASVDAILRDKPLPVLRDNWLMRIPGMWRLAMAQPENRVHPIFLLLRLLQLNIFLRVHN